MRIADAHPVARLAHGGVAQADDRERRQPGADVDLDPHLAWIDAVDRERGDAGEHRRDATRAIASGVGHGAVPILRKIGAAALRRIGTRVNHVSHDRP